MSIGIFGCGRLASAIREAAAQRSAASTIAWCLDRNAEPGDPVSVAIDCSIGAAVPAHIAWALATETPLVVAATGWEAADLAQRVGDRIGVVVAPNGSLTVALLTRLTRVFAAYGMTLDLDHETASPESAASVGGYLLDHHHGAKRDTPSGTALRVAAEWRDVAGDRLPLELASMRAGSAVGTHVLGVDTPGEQLELIHRARTRAPFAHGLLRAADWIVGRRGVFTMDDVASATLDPILRTIHGAST